MVHLTIVVEYWSSVEEAWIGCGIPSEILYENSVEGFRASLIALLSGNNDERNPLRSSSVVQAQPLHVEYGIPENVSEEGFDASANMEDTYDWATWITVQELLEYPWAKEIRRVTSLNAADASWYDKFGTVPIFAEDDADGDGLDEDDLVEELIGGVTNLTQTFTPRQMWGESWCEFTEKALPSLPERGRVLFIMRGL